jgi:hypothetical protein
VDSDDMEYTEDAIDNMIFFFFFFFRVQSVLIIERYTPA